MKSRLRLRTLVRVVALLLFAAVVTMWVRGYRTADAVSWQRWHNDGGKYLGAF